MTAPRDGDERPWLVLASDGPPLAALVDVPPVQLEIPTGCTCARPVDTMYGGNRGVCATCGRDIPE